jgi:hypothetical protein
MKFLFLIAILAINSTFFVNTQDCQGYERFEIKCGQMLECPEGGCFDITQEDLPEGWKILTNDIFLEFNCNKYIIPEFMNDCGFCPTPDGTRRIWKSLTGTPYCVIFKC